MFTCSFVSPFGHGQASTRERAQATLKAKLQAALQEEVSLVERVQALEAEKGGLEQRAAELEARAGSCEEELAAARSGGSAEAAYLEGRVRECTERMRELEEMVAAGRREREVVEAERAGLLERIGGLEREVCQKLHASITLHHTSLAFLFLQRVDFDNSLQCVCGLLQVDHDLLERFLESTHRMEGQVEAFRVGRDELAQRLSREMETTSNFQNDLEKARRDLEISMRESAENEDRLVKVNNLIFFPLCFGT